MDIFKSRNLDYIEMNYESLNLKFSYLIEIDRITS